MQTCRIGSGGELAQELEKAGRNQVSFEDRVLLRLRDAASREDRPRVGQRFLQAQQEIQRDKDGQR